MMMMRSFLIAILLTLLWSSPAFADLFTLAIATLAGAGAAGLAVYTGVIAGSAFFGYFLLATGISLATGYIAQALAPSPPDININQGYKVAGVAAAAQRAVIYGQTRVGGVIVYKEVTDDNKWLHQVIAIAGHECEAVTAIYFDEVRINVTPMDNARQEAIEGRGSVNLSLDDEEDLDEDEEYDFDYIKAEVFYGHDDQQACESLIEVSDGYWTSAHRLRGVCYVYVALKFDTKTWPNGEPAISFEVKGKRVYDYRTGARAYSTNSALIMADYIASDFGVNDAESIDENSFAAAANICDEMALVKEAVKAGGFIAGGIIRDIPAVYEKRYTANGSFLVGGKVKQIMDDINSSMGGTVWYSQGKWQVKPAYYTLPIADFDENDLRSNLKIVTRRSRKDSFNIVTGVYKGPDTNYQATDYPSARSDTFLEVDNNIASSISLDLPFTDSPQTAHRIATIMLRRNREQITITALFGLNGFKVQVGDHLTLTNKRMGWDAKEFQVNDWKLKPDKNGNLSIEMVLQEISRPVFNPPSPRNEDNDRSLERNNTHLFNYQHVPPIGISVQAITNIDDENVNNVILITTTTNSPELLDYVEVRYRRADDVDSIGALVGIGEVGISQIINPPHGDYIVTAQGVNTLRVRGRIYSSRVVTVKGDNTIPSNVTNFGYSLIDNGLFFQWDAVPDRDLSYYKIRHSSALGGARWADAITLAEKVARPASSVSLPAIVGTYMIKAFDKSGNQSAMAAAIEIRPEELEVLPNVATAEESPDFLGHHDGTAVIEGTLSNATAFGNNPVMEATYTFANRIDLGGLHRARVGIQINLERHQLGDRFDDLLGNFDSLQGDFDDISINADFDDINVIPYVSVNDGPGNSVGGWTDYIRFTTGDFYGRSFRFRIVLISAMAGVSPNIHTLIARVRYK